MLKAQKLKIGGENAEFQCWIHFLGLHVFFWGSLCDHRIERPCLLSWHIWVMCLGHKCCLWKPQSLMIIGGDLWFPETPTHAHAYECLEPTEPLAAVYKERTKTNHIVANRILSPEQGQKNHCNLHSCAALKRPCLPSGPGVWMQFCQDSNLGAVARALQSPTPPYIWVSLPGTNCADGTHLWPRIGWPHPPPPCMKVCNRLSGTCSISYASITSSWAV